MGRIGVGRYEVVAVEDKLNPPDKAAREVECEAAYRRGVHQAIAVAKRFIVADGGDAVEILGQWQDVAGKFRSDGKVHSFLIDEIVREVAAMRKAAA